MPSKKEKSKSKPKKKKNRLNAGRLEAYVHANDQVAVLLEMRCQTDFCAKSDKFQELAHNIAMQIAAMGSEDLEKQPFIKDQKKTIGELLKESRKKLGEEIKLKKFVRYEV